jgi:hypothetical protein
MPANAAQKNALIELNKMTASVATCTMSMASSKQELWEARVDASTGAQFFVHRHTKAVRLSPPSHSVPELSTCPRVHFTGSVDAFRKQLVVIMSSPALSPETKEKECRCALADTWHLLCAEAAGDRAADPVFYVGVLMDVYESACISASAMLGSDAILASSLSFLVKPDEGATLILNPFLCQLSSTDALS